MSTAACNHKTALSDGRLRRCMAAAIVSICANALLVLGLAAWDMRKLGNAPPPPTSPPMIVVNTELETPRATEIETGTARAVEEEPARPLPPDPAIPTVELPASPFGDPAFPALADVPTPDLSSWSPMPDIPLPAEIGEPVDVRPADGGAPARVTRGPVMLGTPPLSAFYPFRARARGITGQTQVRLTIDRSGRVTDVRVVTSTPPGVFDSAAVRACKQLLFQPALRDGDKVISSIPLRLVWRLQE